MKTSRKNEAKAAEPGFPKDFLWGASTSAYQVEGGAITDWSQWEMSEKRLADLRRAKLDYRDFVAGRACDSFNRYAEDVDILKQLDLNAYRFGLEWARIEPVEGEFSEEAIEHYRSLLLLLKQNGLKTAVTIWHWTNPVWLSSDGGWADKKVVRRFGRYAAFVASRLGDLVDYWITLNEPTVHVLNGYLNGKFPPNKRSFFQSVKVFFNLVEAHKSAYRLIHKLCPSSPVSITHLGNNFEAARKWLLPEIILAWALNLFGNGLLLGKIKKYIDYIGLDYYFHNRVVWHPPFLKNKNRETTDVGWEIYPKGIYNILKHLKRYRKPIIIMENGLADAKDMKREKFIRDHLSYVQRAIAEGIPVKGYFHWSLLDNFEWALGWAPKFGLCEVDRETFERKIRPSAYAYAKIAKNNKLED